MAVAWSFVSQSLNPSESKMPGIHSRDPDINGFVYKVTDRADEATTMRRLADTVKPIVDSPTLMRLRELEILEKVTASSKHNILSGERVFRDRGLTDRVMNEL